MGEGRPIIEHAQHTHLIVNPRSGRGGIGRRIDGIIGRLQSCGERVVVHRTRGVGHATELAATVCDTARAVVAVGGDGTVRETAAGLMNRPAPLAILPGGTENLIARQLGFGSCPDQLVRRLLRRDLSTLDVAFADETPFLLIAGVGFDAEVVERVSRKRRGHITQMDYFWPIWRTFWNHRYPSVRVRADGHAIFEGAALVFVGNMPRYATGLQICKHADWTDGRLDLCILPARHQLDLLLHAASVATRRHLRRGGVLYRQAGLVEIDSPEDVPVECDGDRGGRLPMRFTVRRGALRVLGVGSNEN